MAHSRPPEAGGIRVPLSLVPQHPLQRRGKPAPGLRPWGLGHRESAQPSASLAAVVLRIPVPPG